MRVWYFQDFGRPTHRNPNIWADAPDLCSRTPSTKRFRGQVKTKTSKPAQVLSFVYNPDGGRTCKPASCDLWRSGVPRRSATNARPWGAKRRNTAPRNVNDGKIRDAVLGSRAACGAVDCTDPLTVPRVARRFPEPTAR